MSVWHSITDFFGITNEAGPGYGFWSGFGSDLGEFALVGAVIGTYRKHMCHVDGCWRIQRHVVEGTPYVVCRRHHPKVHGAVTEDHVMTSWVRANQAKIRREEQR